MRSRCRKALLDFDLCAIVRHGLDVADTRLIAVDHGHAEVVEVEDDGFATLC